MGRGSAAAVAASRCLRWFLAWITCIVACSANPYGINALRLTLVLYDKLSKSGDNSFYQQLTPECVGHLDSVRQQGLIALCDTSGVLVLAVTLLGFASVLFLLHPRARIDGARILILLLFTFLGWQARKSLPYFAIATAAVALWNLDDLLAARDDRRSTASSAASVWLRLSGSRVCRAAPVALLLLLDLSVPANFYYGLVDGRLPPRDRRSFAFSEDLGMSPHLEAKFLGRQGMPDCVLGLGPQMGSCYLFHNGPRRKVFVDGRLEVGSRETFQKCSRIWEQFMAHDPAAERTILADVPADPRGDRRMPAILLGLDDLELTDEIESAVTQPRWSPVFCGPSAVVFLYASDARRLRLAPVNGNALRAALYRRFLESHPRCAPAHFNLGLALQQSDPAAAEEHYRRAWQIEPALSAAHDNYALLVEAEQPSLAEEHYQRAVACDPASADACLYYAGFLARRGAYSRAAVLYGKALEINPHLDAARRNLAALKARRSK
jgi:hypothetical protein